MLFEHQTHALAFFGARVKEAGFWLVPPSLEIGGRNRIFAFHGMDKSSVSVLMESWDFEDEVWQYMNKLLSFVRGVVTNPGSYENSLENLIEVKANAVRALGNLSRFIQLASQPILHGDLENLVHLKLETDGAKAPKREMLDSFPLQPLGSSNCLDQMVQAFLSCVTTGNVKVQWNVCHALSNLFSNKTLKLQDKDWGSSVFSILLLLLRDSSNFKIRIQAAAALAVPQTLSDYGRSYYDVVKGVVHVVENFKSDQISEPSNFKYWIALLKQLTSTMLHLLGLAGSCDQRVMQDLLTKKASFLEVWIKDLCASLGDTTYAHGEAKQLPTVYQKRDFLLATIQSLVRVYENSNQHLVANKFEKLANGLR